MPTIYTGDAALEGLRLGDEDAFEQIYDRYWHKLYRVAENKVRESDEAKEIAQDIFLDLWARRGTVAICELEHYLPGAVKFKVGHCHKKIEWFCSKPACTNHQVEYEDKYEF